jgi:hypothetical protein
MHDVYMVEGIVLERQLVRQEIAMLPRYSTSDVRFEAVERELHVNEIKANKGCVWPLARGINSPHTNSLDPRLVAVDNWA